MKSRARWRLTLLAPLFVSWVLGHQALANIPKDEIVKEWRAQNLNASQDWDGFLSRHGSQFPGVSTSEIVEKAKIRIDGKDHIYGEAFRQIKLNAPLERVREILLRPDLFRESFGLDEEAHLGPLKNPLATEFMARIKLRLPIVPDQNYELRYRLLEKPNRIFQFVEQVKDHEDFALRETLVVVEAKSDFVMFREVGRVMPLSWAMRALGAQLRQITKSELQKMNKALKCMAESQNPLTDELAKKCRD